jgi:hypothetical protein
MSDRKTTLTFAVSVAFLIPSVLSFAQAPAGPSALPSQIKVIRQQSVDQDNLSATSDRWRERDTPANGDLLHPRQTPWSILAFDRYEALKPTL